MRRLFLVGMAPPADGKRCARPFPVGLSEMLIALDPRHGVFPNLVMTPLLSTLFQLRDKREQLNDFLGQLTDLLGDDGKRRFNVFASVEDGLYLLSEELHAQLSELHDRKKLWVVFGYWSVAGILWSLFNPSAIRGELAEEDLVALPRILVVKAGRLAPRKLSMTAVLGVIHRLCTGDGKDLQDLELGVRKILDEKGYSAQLDRVVAALRSIVPISHNEAYQTLPTGHIQNHFVLGKVPTDSDNPELFWKYIGQAIARRLVSEN